MVEYKIDGDNRPDGRRGAEHGLIHYLDPTFLGKDLKHAHEGFGEGLKLGEVLQAAEQLHRNGTGDEQQAHSENNQRAELLSWPEYLIDEIFQYGRCLDQAHDSKYL